MTWTAFKNGIEFLEQAFNISPKLKKDTEMAPLYKALRDKIKGDDHWHFIVKVLRDTTERWNPRWEGYNPVAAFLKLYKEHPYTAPVVKKEVVEDEADYASPAQWQELKQKLAAKMTERGRHEEASG